PAMPMAGPITSAGWPNLPPGATRARTPGTAGPARSNCLSVLAIAALEPFALPGASRGQAGELEAGAGRLDEGARAGGRRLCQQVACGRGIAVDDGFGAEVEIGLAFSASPGRRIGAMHHRQRGGRIGLAEIGGEDWPR